MRVLVTDPLDRAALERVRAAGHDVVEKIGVKGSGLIAALDGCEALLIRDGAAPMITIVNNGGKDGSVVADEILEKGGNIGYDANTGEYVDMYKAGIIDPVKVVRTALANAASIASLLLTTEALVTNLDKEDKKKRSVEGAVR